MEVKSFIALITRGCTIKIMDLQFTDYIISLICLPKLVRVTDNNKDASLLCNLSICRLSRARNVLQYRPPGPVLYSRLERLAKDKHSCLIRKSVNYGRKFFIVHAPGLNVIKIFSSVIY